MVATSPEDEPPRQQINTGPGTFVGRDNNTYNFEMVDEKTKSVLRKLSKEAPALAKLLDEALRDGVIPRDAVYAIELAARNINADVAEALLIAGQNINEDVAEHLVIAARSLNEEAVERIASNKFELSAIADKLEQAARQLNASSGNSAIDRLDTTLTRIDNSADRITIEADRMEDTFTPPAPISVVNWRATGWAFVAGLIVGIVIVGIIVAYNSK